MKKTDASRRSRVTSVLLAAGVLVGAANIGAYAATGHPLVLGHRNTAGHTTTLVNTGKGAALALHGKKSSPPLSVGSNKKVTHLNADLLDGRSAGSLANSVIVYQLRTNGSGSRVHYTFPGLPSGVFQVSYYVNRALKASGSAAPRMTCSFAPTSTTKGQGTMLSAAGTHATVSASVVARVDGTAGLTCTVAGGSLTSTTLGAASGISFLKVDRAASGVAARR